MNERGCPRTTLGWAVVLGVLSAVIGIALGASAARAANDVTQVRSVAPFHAIDTNGEFNIIISIGNPQSVAVTASSDAIEQVATKTENGTLSIKMTRYYYGPTPSIAIVTPHLDALRIDGSTEVDINGLRGRNFNLTVDGNGTVKAAGSVNAVGVAVNGAGKVDLGGLVASDVDVACNGSGSIRVNATQTLNAAINGIGKISYLGKPKTVNRKVNGIGTIEPE